MGILLSRRLRQLGSSSPAKRCRAARKLGRRRNARVVERLIAALKDPDASVRAAVAEALGQIGEPSAVPPLVAALEAEKRRPRRLAPGATGGAADVPVASTIVASLGSEGFEMLVTIGRDPADVVRIYIVQALGRIGDQAAVATLGLAMRDWDQLVGYTAAQALGQIGNSYAVEHLVGVLTWGRRLVRQAATEELQKLGWKPTDGCERARYAIARSRDKAFSEAVAEGEAAVGPLIEVLKGTSRTDRDRAENGLVKLGEPAVVPLLAALHDTGGKDRDCIVKAVIRVGRAGEAGCEGMVALLNEAPRHLRPQAAEILGYLGDAGPPFRMGYSIVVPSLLALYRDEAPEVRQAVVEALGRTGDPRAVEPLSHALTAGDSSLRSTAVWALVDLLEGSCRQKGLDEALSLFVLVAEKNLRVVPELADTLLGRELESSYSEPEGRVTRLDQIAEAVKGSLLLAIESDDDQLRKTAERVLAKTYRAQTGCHTFLHGSKGALEFARREMESFDQPSTRRITIAAQLPLAEALVGSARRLREVQAIDDSHAIYDYALRMLHDLCESRLETNADVPPRAEEEPFLDSAARALEDAIKGEAEIFESLGWSRRIAHLLECHDLLRPRICAQFCAWCETHQVS